MEKLHPEILWQGVVLSNKNANSLLEVAQDAAIRQAFGTAASLAILSAEESAKAMGLATRALSHRPDSVHLKKYFSNHKHKHNAGAVFLGVMEFYNLLMDEMYAIEADKTIDDNEKGSLLAKRMILLAESELSGERSSFEEINSWRERADHMKKIGFYVDWTDESWSSPQDIGRAEYEMQHNRATALLVLGNVMVSLGLEGCLSEYQKTRENA